MIVKKHLSLVLLIIASCLGSPLMAPANAQKQHKLSAKAQAAMDQGLAAARQQDWDHAIEHFSEAAKDDPADPTAMFNLALAYEKAGGRELIAICWYNMYLIMAPHAPRAAFIRKHIAALEDAVEDNMRRLVKIEQNTISHHSKAETKGALIYLAASKIYLGDVQAGFQIAKSLEGSSAANHKTIAAAAYDEISFASALMGDFIDAKIAIKRRKAIAPPDYQPSQTGNDITHWKELWANPPSGGLEDWKSYATALADKSMGPRAETDFSSFLNSLKKISAKSTDTTSLATVYALSNGAKQLAQSLTVIRLMEAADGYSISTISFAARAAIEHGLAAAKQRNWQLAISAFRTALKEAPSYTPAILNLALAYDAAGGHEFPALCLYRAFLIAKPNAGRARKRIAALEVVIEKNMHKLTAAARAIVYSLPTDIKLPTRFSIPYEHRSAKRYYMYRLAATYGVLGEMREAKRVVIRMAKEEESSHHPSSPLKDLYKVRAYSLIARWQAWSGDIAAAKNTQKLYIALAKNYANSNAYYDAASRIINANTRHGPPAIFRTVRDWTLKADSFGGQYIPFTADDFHPRGTDRASISTENFAAYLSAANKQPLSAFVDTSTPRDPDYTYLATSDFADFLRKIKKLPAALSAEQLMDAVVAFGRELRSIREHAGEETAKR